jgi:2',3'-cyclic-nucleotide 2'-phosphodiesterase (5'-nucleotidase family)
LPVSGARRPDAATEAVVGRYWRSISAKYGRRIGTADADFAQKGFDRADYNLVADAVRAKTNAEIAFENLGGVRAPLVKGPITYADLVTMDPFGNTIITMILTGAQVRAILANRRPAVSGIGYELDGRVVKRASVGGRPLDDSRTYRVATNSFFARDALFKSAAQRADTGVARLSALIEYVERRGRVRPSYDGRRIVRGVPDE